MNKALRNISRSYLHIIKKNFAKFNIVMPQPAESITEGEISKLKISKCNLIDFNYNRNWGFRQGR